VCKGTCEPLVHVEAVTKSFVFRFAAA
jgi:hypothetical protein